MLSQDFNIVVGFRLKFISFTLGLGINVNLSVL